MPGTPAVRLPGRAWLRRGVVAAATGDGITLVNASGQVFHLNNSGQLAVEALRGGAVATAVAVLRDYYGLTHANRPRKTSPGC